MGKHLDRGVVCRNAGGSVSSRCLVCYNIDPQMTSGSDQKRASKEQVKVDNLTI